MKTYVLTLSVTFPKGHPRAGEPTNFKEKMANAIYHMRHPEVFEPGEPNNEDEKYHTIRANNELWKKRFEEIERGEACLSIRQWSGLPYRSKQETIAVLTKDDGIGIQKLKFASDRDGQQCWWNFAIDGRYCHYDTKADYVPNELAENDGLSYKDWQDWFRNYDLSKPLAIIHFTKFRY